jgi:hypothetical protein
MYVCIVHSSNFFYVCVLIDKYTAILIIFGDRFQVFDRFSGSKLLLKTVGSRFAALNYYENGSILLVLWLILSVYV